MHSLGKRKFFNNCCGDFSVNLAIVGGMSLEDNLFILRFLPFIRLKVVIYG